VIPFKGQNNHAITRFNDLRKEYKQPITFQRVNQPKSYKFLLMTDNKEGEKENE